MKTGLKKTMFCGVMVILTMTVPGYTQDVGPMDRELVGEEGESSFESENVFNSGGEEMRYVLTARLNTTTPGTGTKDTKKEVKDLKEKDSVAAQQSAAQPVKIKSEKPIPATKPTVQKQSKEEDDSILSFNFLYYMIQKYKMQDIVD